MKRYIYEVFGELDNELIDFCNTYEIGYASNSKCIVFSSTSRKALESLHDEFFDDYEFEVEERN